MSYSQQQREQLKERIPLLTEKQRKFFMRLYSHDDLTRSMDNAIDLMDDDQLVSAVRQVENTIKKNEQ